jgi:hypothetical protein
MSPANRPSMSRTPRSPSPDRRVARATTTAALLALSLSSACAGHDDEAEAPVVQELAADWVHPACQSEALMPPAANSCGGPWRFGYVETSSDPAVCGEDPNGTCTANKACLSWNSVTTNDGGGAVLVPPSTASSAAMNWNCTTTRGRTSCTGVQPNQPGAGPDLTWRSGSSFDRLPDLA